MTRTVPLPALLALLLCLPACRSRPEMESAPPYPPLQSAELGSMRNVSRSGELWFGSAPTETDLDLAVRRGIVTVIDLSTPDEDVDPDIGAICRKKGLDFLDVGDVEREVLSDATVDAVLAGIEQGGGEPILLFCGNGTRCAMFVAIYRVAYEGVPLEQALVEARRAGMKPGEPELFVREQVERLHARAL